MSTTTVTAPAMHTAVAQTLGVWAAAALPMGILAWIVAPTIKDNFSGTGTIPMFKALILLLTAGLVWQCVLVAGLVWREQRTLRWVVVRDVLWLRSLNPWSPPADRFIRILMMGKYLAQICVFMCVVLCQQWRSPAQIVV